MSCADDDDDVAVRATFVLDELAGNGGSEIFNRIGLKFELFKVSSTLTRGEDQYGGTIAVSFSIELELPKLRLLVLFRKGAGLSG